MADRALLSNGGGAIKSSSPSSSTEMRDNLRVPMPMCARLCPLLLLASTSMAMVPMPSVAPLVGREHVPLLLEKMKHLIEVSGLSYSLLCLCGSSILSHGIYV